MKTKLPVIAALSLGLCATGSAFTLDFIGFVGTSLPPTLTIMVPGYGTVDFETGAGSNLVVDNAFMRSNGTGAPSLSFDQGDSVKITFNGLQPINIDFDFVGVSPGEAFVVQPDLFTPQAFVVTLQGGGDGAGLHQIGFDAVPEPSSSLLGLLGCSLLVLRRRR